MVRSTTTNVEYSVRVYSRRGLGFYPLMLTISIFLSMSLAMNNEIYILLTIVMLGITALPLSIQKVLKSVNVIEGVTISVSSLNAVEDDHIDMTIVFNNQLFKLLKIRKLIIISDAGIKVSETHLRRIKDSLTIEILLKGFCGKHQIKGVALYLSDLLLYTNYRIEFALTRPISIHIIPKQLHIELDVERNIPYISYEAKLSRRKGLGVNILGIREYLPGDDYRRIDWKATARTSKLMVKEFEKHLCRDVLFIASINDRFFVGNPPAVVHLLRIILNLLIRIANAGVNLGIGIATEDEIIVSSKITRYNMKYIYETLSQITWPLAIKKKSYSSANRIVRWFINELTSKFCSESCLVVVFIDVIDDLDIENIRKIIKELRMRHYTLKIFLVKPTVIRFLLSSIELNELNDLRNELSMYEYVMKYFGDADVVSSIINLL